MYNFLFRLSFVGFSEKRSCGHYFMIMKIGTVFSLVAKNTNYV